MILTFEDTDGRTGTVTDELTLEYDGEWKERIRERIETSRSGTGPTTR
jgi:hypothetical protein